MWMPNTKPALAAVVALLLLSVDSTAATIVLSYRAGFTPAKIDGIVIDYLGVSADERGVSRFRITNQSKAPVYYDGYDVSMPLYALETKGFFGWHDAGMGWCGTGALVRRLDPGRSAYFDVRHAAVPGKTYRVGIRLFLSDGADAGVTVWSASAKAPVD